MAFFKKLKNAIKSLSLKSDVSDFELEDILIEADFGVDLAQKIAKDLKRSKNISEDLKERLESILSPLIKSIEIDSAKKPYVILMIGINGSGKTTTIAKIATLLKNRGLSVDIAACDTFRAAATDQLSIWADRLGCQIFKSDTPKDPASVAYEAMRDSKSDVLIVDTAGRLHNNTNLMNELVKIQKVLQKIDPETPHKIVMTIDATVGQNTIEQIREFKKVCPISGIILTKMDGGAKGGIIIRIAEEYQIPILGIGVGETVTDLEKFSVNKFLEDLVGE